MSVATGIAIVAAALGVAMYLRNLLVARQQGLRHEHVGILASAVNAYASALEHEVRESTRPS